ncbi:helix-turn-helix domain-containing protein [Microbacterium sp. NPDC077663]|uniref:helix-turn-helix domain-containing protein n=1 Tax=Microbacterium sp. NPDC077663 TaxID=3364189 RepID=UPI0037C64CCF
MRADLDAGVRDHTVSATDAGGARAALAQLASDVEIREIGAPFHLRQRTVGDDRLLLSSFTIAPHLHFESGISGGIGIARRRAGSLRAVTNGEEVDASRPFLIRPGRAESWSEDVAVDLVSLDLSALGAFAGFDESALHVGGTAAVSPQLQRHWDLTIDHVTRVFGDRELLHNPLIRQAAVDAVFAATAHAFDIRSTADRADSRAGSDAVRRATAFIEEHLGEPLSVGDIAHAAGLSVRGLQSAFARVRDTTPAAYVRTARLRAVRRELVEAEPAEATVAEVARRWGFAHLPRSAKHYREEFGEQPSETLRRIR